MASAGPYAKSFAPRSRLITTPTPYHSFFYYGPDALPDAPTALTANLPISQQQQPFYGPLSQTTQVSRYQKKHSPTHTYPDHQPSSISFLHLLQCIASSLFNLRVSQSICTTSLQVSLVYFWVWNLHVINDISTIHIGMQWNQLPEFIPSNSNSGLHSCISISFYTCLLYTSDAADE